MTTDKDERIELCADGIRVCVLPFGATLQSVVVNDAGGKPTDVILGFNTADEYRDSDLYFGGTVGRVANRIGGAAFELNGKTYRLAKNDGENHLHGGREKAARFTITATASAWKRSISRTPSTIRSSPPSY